MTGDLGETASVDEERDWNLHGSARRTGVHFVPLKLSVNLDDYQDDNERGLLERLRNRLRASRCKQWRELWPRSTDAGLHPTIVDEKHCGVASFSDWRYY